MNIDHFLAEKRKEEHKTARAAFPHFEKLRAEFRAKLFYGSAVFGKSTWSALRWFSKAKSLFQCSIGLEEEFSIKVGVHELSVLSPVRFSSQ